MEWAEIKRRLTKEGTSVQVLADLEGVPYKTMYNRIMQHQIKDGVTYMTPKNTKGMKRSGEMKALKGKKIKEAEKAAGLPEVVPLIVTDSYNCSGCAHSMRTSCGLLCSNGHECSENNVCSEYKPFMPISEAVKETENIPEEVYTNKEEPRPLVPVSDPEREGLCPEVMETLRENYERCRKMAESYLKQANDYLHLLKRYGVDIPKAQEEFRRKLPEVMSL